MASFNKCMFIGNLGGDPELRYTPNGKAIASFSVAVNRNFKDQNDEWQSATEWINAVVLNGDSAERAAEQLRKGSLVFIEGRQETQTWTDKETGKPARRVVHILTDWKNLTKREGEGTGSRGPDVLDTIERDPRHEGQFAGSVSTPSSPVRDDLDDLPF